MKLFLAGLQRYSFLITRYRPKYILESFAYIRETEVEEFLSAEMFLLDSGAFTFLSKENVEIDWIGYVSDYADFIKRHNIENFFELDIYKIVGVEKTETLRDLLEQKTGRRSIPVWHRMLGREYLHKLTEDYDYIGFGGFAIQDIKPAEYKFIPPLLKIAAANGCRVHGLGFTHQEGLKFCKFYSVDSTSWNGGRFGTAFVFKNGRIEYNRRPSKRIKSADVIPHNFTEWVKFQKYADLYL